MTEEALSALWFIVAFLAHLSGCPKWFVVILFLKAAADHYLAIKYAIEEICAENTEP